MKTPEARQRAFQGLVDRGLLTAEQLRLVLEAAEARGRPATWVLVHEAGVPRRALLERLREAHGRLAVEFDERLSVPPALLDGADAAALHGARRFPLLLDDERLVVAAADPEADDLQGEILVQGRGRRLEAWASCEEDVDWYIQDFLHAPRGALVGTERTGLAFWRNTMAQWRTRMACYRTDFAKSRTSLALLRWGLGLVALAIVLGRTGAPGDSADLAWLLVASGLGIALASVPGYWNIRRSTARPPGEQTLVEVTSATLGFLDAYTPAAPAPRAPSRLTMLARLGDLLQEHRAPLEPPPVQKERAPLARERNVLAGQRTVAACYRTIYARARTGLAFIRTGVTFVSLGLGLIQYFGVGPYTFLDGLLVGAGLLLVADGLWWYLPVRREQAEFPESLECLAAGREA